MELKELIDPHLRREALITHIFKV